MDMTKFSAFKYQHTGRGEISTARRRATMITLVLAVIATIAFFPGGALAFVVPLLVRLTAPKMLYIGPRYLICGNVIVYFNNVVRMVLERDAGTLSLVTASERSFVLERERFPTGARKAEKIKINKGAKFDKASGKLVERIVRASPEVELTGIARPAPEAAGA